LEGEYVFEDDNRAFLGQGWAFPVEIERSGAISTARYDEDIRQAVLIILKTEQGERVMRPDFGVGLRSLVFEPINVTTKSLVRHRVEEALITWEPRIEVQTITVSDDPATPGLLNIDIRYLVRLTNTFYNLVYPFYLMER
jgi:uncharacterized protein